jgi:L-aminopeptidase/D-esterase-like protein
MPQVRGPLETVTQVNPEHLDPLYLAAVEAVDEAVLNAIVAGEDVTTVKPPGLMCRAIDKARLAGMFVG